jgi:hypothetical protein
METGYPIDHACRILPPTALLAERQGNIDKAIDILQMTPKVFVGVQPPSEAERKQNTAG